jgi:phosphoribosylformylglycinamidine synthase
MKPKVCILRTDGTNCDKETAYAFNKVGGDAEIQHINHLIKHYDHINEKPVSLDDYHILVWPGGFSYGDYIAAGKVLAREVKKFLGEEVEKFVADGKIMIGICNGFQALIKAGYLPNIDGKNEQTEETATLTYNDSQRFECRWVKLASPENKCIWTKGVERLDIPVAHGEGKFIAPEKTIKQLFENSQVVYQYADSEWQPSQEFPANPNGSLEAIAGICDPTGRIFGLMPHPERYNQAHNHHLATLQKIHSRGYVDKNNPIVQERIKITGEYTADTPGLKILKNGIDYIVKNL